MVETERRLAAIMFTDIVGYTALMGESEEAGLRVRERHRALLEPLAEENHGRIADENGDELVLIFPSALDAVRCALGAQRKLAQDPDLKLRIGIHSGDVVFEGERIYGDGVNVASRIRPLAEAGGICVSGPVYDSIKNHPEIECTPLGQKQLKNVDRPVSVIAVSGIGSSAATGRRPVVARAPGRGAAVRWALSGALALLVLGFLGWWLVRPTATGGAIRSLAVLPLENLSGDPQQEYFADGMTEVVIGNLSKIRELRVISRTSVMKYKAARKPLPEVARELGVDAVVEGSVLRVGDRVRITAHLIDARVEAHLWSKSYERDMVDVLALQADVARAIARAVQLELASGRTEERRIDPRAYEAYLAGWEKVAESGRVGHVEAVASFRRAAELEPEWASAWGGLATALSCSCIWTSPTEGLALAREAADRALALDPENPEGLIARALVQVFGDWDWAAGERNARRAVELQPSLVWARFVYSMVLQVGGDLDGALAQEEIKRELDPLAPNPNLANLYSNHGDHRAAEAEWQRSLQSDPPSSRVLRFAGEYYCNTGEHARGLALLERADELEDDARSLSNLGWCHALSGDAAGARRILAALDVLADSAYVDPTGPAAVYLALGDEEAALGALERAFELRSFTLPFARTNPRFAPLHDDPRFVEIISRMKLPLRGRSGGRV